MASKTVSRRLHRMADTDQKLRELAGMLASPLTRRQALMRAAALGLSIPALSALSAKAAPQPASPRSLSRNATTNLSFYHDKAPWEDYFKAMSDLSAEQIDISFT